MKHSYVLPMKIADGSAAGLYHVLDADDCIIIENTTKDNATFIVGAVNTYAIPDWLNNIINGRFTIVKNGRRYSWPFMMSQTAIESQHAPLEFSGKLDNVRITIKAEIDDNRE